MVIKKEELNNNKIKEEMNKKLIHHLYNKNNEYKVLKSSVRGNARSGDFSSFYFISSPSYKEKFYKGY